MEGLLKGDGWGALALIALVYPLATIILAELQRRMETRDSNYASAVRQLQTTVLPCAALYVLMTQIGGVDANPVGADGSRVPLAALSWPTIFAKIVLTAASIFLINAALSAFNAFLVSQRQTGSVLANIPGLLLDLLRVGLVLLAGAIIISTVWGADLQSALVGLGVGGIVLGLALQDTLSAVFAGLSMVSTRTFKSGDWLKTGDLEGRVVAMDWRSVTVETEQKTLAVVPNSELAGATFVVESAEGLPFGEEVALFFSYDDPPEKVIEVIDDTARQIDGLLTHPPHEVEVLNFDEKGIEYELMFFTADRGEAWRVRSDFLRRFWYAARRAGLTPVGAQNRLFRGDWETASGTLDRFGLLSRLSLFQPAGEGLEELADAVRVQDFGRDELLQTIDERFRFVHVLLDGDVTVRNRRGRPLQLLGPGEFFVTRAILTGAESPVALRSDAACRVLSIPQPDLLAYADRNRDFASRLEQLIEQMDEAASGGKDGGSSNVAWLEQARKSG